MRLPNPIPGVITEYLVERPRKARLAKNFNVRQDANELLASLAQNVSDKAILAYIWLAVESNYNILVLSENSKTSDTFTDAISAFVPGWAVALDVPRTGEALERRLNFMSAVGESAGRPDTLMQTKMPDRIIVKDAKGRLDEIFESSKHGTSFIAQAKGNFYNRRIVKALQARPFSIKRDNIIMLDLSIIIKEDSPATNIAAITEYSWLSRAETREKRMLKDYSNMHITKCDKLNLEEIRDSKLIWGYSRSNLISKDQVLEELGRRADFLEQFCKSNNQRNIKMYYEIK